MKSNNLFSNFHMEIGNPRNENPSLLSNICVGAGEENSKAYTEPKLRFSFRTLGE